jgi:hypothetical protein
MSRGRPPQRPGRLWASPPGDRQGSAHAPKLAAGDVILHAPLRSVSGASGLDRIVGIMSVSGSCDAVPSNCGRGATTGPPGCSAQSPPVVFLARCCMCLQGLFASWGDWRGQKVFLILAIHFAPPRASGSLRMNTPSETPLAASEGLRPGCQGLGDSGGNAQRLAALESAVSHEWSQVDSQLPDKEEVPGSSPGSPTPRKALENQGFRGTGRPSTRIPVRALRGRNPEPVAPSWPHFLPGRCGFARERPATRCAPRGREDRPRSPAERGRARRAAAHRPRGPALDVVADADRRRPGARPPARQPRAALARRTWTGHPYRHPPAPLALGPPVTSQSTCSLANKLTRAGGQPSRLPLIVTGLEALP